MSDLNDLSEFDISLIDTALYRFYKDNKHDMSDELRNHCKRVYGIIRRFEGKDSNLK